MERQIAHFHLPDFSAALEELRRPELRKHPLALAEPRARALLLGVNAAARGEGLNEGMPLIEARRLCKRLTVLPPDHRFYREQHAGFIEVLGGFSPLVEGTLPGRYFVDLTGTRRLWGSAPDAVFRVEKELAERRAVLVSAGLAPNKLVSRVAASIMPPGDLGFVFPGGEASFLSPLPVSSLPGVGRKTSALLYDFNVRWIGELANLPDDSLAHVLGIQGVRLVKLARGIDFTPVIPDRKAPALSVERLLDRDEIDRDCLEGILLELVEEAAWNLRRLNRYAQTFALEIRYADGMTAQGRKSMSAPAPNGDREFFGVVRALFLRMFTRRVAVRRFTLELHRLAMPSRQLPLFADDEQEAGMLQGALDEVRSRFGREAVHWGRVTAAGGRERSLAA